MRLLHTSYIRRTSISMSYYELRHSSGVWKDHKYIKKEGDKYIYSKEQMAEYESHRDDDSSDGKKWTYGSGSTPLNRYNSVGEGKNAKSIAELIKAGKGGKGSSSSKNSKSDKEKSSKEKTGSTKATKETKEKTSSAKSSQEKTTSEKEPAFQKYQVTSTGAQRALKTYADLTKKDSISTTLNADGNWESTVTYENGDTQKFIMDKRYRILSKGERELKHSYALRPLK